MYFHLIHCITTCAITQSGIIQGPNSHPSQLPNTQQLMAQLEIVPRKRAAACKTSLSPKGPQKSGFVWLVIPSTLGICYIAIENAIHSEFSHVQHGLRKRCPQRVTPLNYPHEVDQDVQNLLPATSQSPSNTPRDTVPFRLSTSR